MIGDYVDLKNIEIFNTPYRIKLKGYLETQYQGVTVYILETHGKMYALELNDNHENIAELSKIVYNHPCILKSELLGFKKICKVKYDKMGLEFPFEKYDQPSKDVVEKLQNMLPR